MLIALKLISFAYNYFDGTYDKKRVFGEHSDPKVAKMYADRKRFAITSLPNPLEFYGYVYCFTCLLAGPAFEYTDYASAVDGSAFSKENGKKNDEKAEEPSSVAVALKALVIGIVALVLHLVVSGNFPIPTLYNKEWIASNDMLFRFGFMWVALTGDRLKYYFAWKVAEGT